MKKDDEILIEKLNPIYGITFTDYESKIKLIIDNLHKIPVINYKLSYIQHRGFNKITEVRYNNDGIKDELGLGKNELESLIDSLVREQALEDTIYMCILSMDKRISYIAFFNREEQNES